ncbi:MAG: hypothetical protein GF372_01225 [Candidatus Marinimicrobia bacterium]|nr:hypothetical protein [Candidatus Neomarinimicrobiota bacterium]
MLPADRHYAYDMCCTRILRWILLFSLLSLTVFNFSCTKEVYLTGEALVRDGKYDSSFPHLSTAEYIEEIIKSVQPVSSMAYYANYYYRPADQVTERALEGQMYEELAVSQEPTNTNVRGSATIIYSGDRRVALLTSAHVVDFPDTILTYYTDMTGQNTEYLQSIAVKTRQMNYVSTLPRLRDQSMDIIAINRETDVAIIGGVMEQDLPGTARALEYPLGNSRELRWGDFIYVLGYPKGKKMVTSGIVSQPNSGDMSNFLIDAPFNIGLSGGIVLAIRDGVPNFEVVGITNSVSADFENIVSPPDTIDSAEIIDARPYSGELYVRRRSRINYGVTNVVSAEAVRELIQSNRQHFFERGYNLRSFIR